MLGIILILGCVGIGIEIYHDRDLSGTAGPSFSDQIVNNGFLLLSIAVSSVLVVLTFSLFKQTTNAITLSRTQADAATGQAKTANDTLIELRKQIDLQIAIEQRAVNAFLDIPPGEPNTWKALRRQCFHLERSDDGEVKSISFGEQYECDEKTSVFPILQEKYIGGLFGLKRFRVEIPIMNSGNGPAVDVSVEISQISWSDVRVIASDSSGSSESEGFILKSKVRKVVFDRIIQSPIMGCMNISDASRRSLHNLMIPPHQAWIIPYEVELLESFHVGPSSFVERDMSDVLNAAMFDTDAIFGRFLEKRFEMGSRGELREKNAPIDLSDRNIDPALRSNYLKLLAMPIGLRLHIRYKNITTASPSPVIDAGNTVGSEDDEVIYNILFSESAVSDQESTLVIDRNLEYVQNKTLNLTKGTLLNEHLSGKRTPLLKTLPDKFHTFEHGCVRFASVDQEKSFADSLCTHISVLTEAADRLPRSTFTESQIEEIKSESSIVEQVLLLGASPMIAYGVDEAVLKSAYQAYINSL